MERKTMPVPEIPVQLRVNDGIIATWTCSPGALDALGVGRVLALGFARNPGHVLAVRVPEPGNGVHTIEVDVALEPARAGQEERRHRSEHGCGLRYLLDCRPDLVHVPDDRAPLPDGDRFPDLFQELFDRSPARRVTGGHHTTGLTDGATLIHVHEEVGRHNGVDKAIGSAVLEGATLSRLGLITTARLSGEIAEKAVRAGLAWIASRSVPTTLAVEIATAARLPLLARAAGKDARVFAGAP
jgi:FdhD protein